MFNRFNKFQAAVALALLSRGALGDSYTNSTSSADLSSITSVSSASASATASDSLSSSDGTVYLPSTTISGDLTVTGKVIATEAVEVAAGGKLTLLDGENTSSHLI
ncbi:AHG_G0047530.mRNA.1.CDS.1 [Saccharomyces cerevisiae]|nr:AHG_G0047530.mRNA.1.CDS.1 [Saccharomyces cerevisiae]CAI6869842.1 AHG_G0047530.mRNA.1.CDS.1 [Saccharomyces cerevisiae]